MESIQIAPLDEEAIRSQAQSAILDQLAQGLADRLGIKPRIEKKITLGELFDKYRALHARQHCRSWRNIERCYASYLSHWSDRDVNSITRQDITELHVSLAERISSITANRVIQLIRPIINFGIDQELVNCQNPAVRCKKFKEVSIDRFLEIAEIERFKAEVKTLRYPTTQDFLWMCLFTGARRSNVAAMAWLT